MQNILREGCRKEAFWVRYRVTMASGMCMANIGFE